MGGAFHRVVANRSTKQIEDKSCCRVEDHVLSVIPQDPAHNRENHAPGDSTEVGHPL